MKKTLGTILTLMAALTLVAITALPVMAADTQSLSASASVNSVVSITLIDVGDAGIIFGSQNAGSTYGDVAQADNTPAVKVSVEDETSGHVDIGIMGGSATGTLTLDAWKYSVTYAGSKVSLTANYVGIYTDQGVGDYDIYHWVTIPPGTTSGANGCTVYYKAVATGTNLE